MKIELELATADTLSSTRIPSFTVLNAIEVALWLDPNREYLWKWIEYKMKANAETRKEE